MKCLMVSTYYPTKCGIATYALQSVEKMRGDGHMVDVLSPDSQGEVDFRSDLRGGFLVLRILKQAFFYDKVTIQYAPSLFFDGRLEGEVVKGITSTLLSFILVLALVRRLELVAHEIVYYSNSELGPVDRFLNRLRWRLVPRLIMHTRKEKDEFLKHYRNANIVLKEHHEDFSKFRDITTEQAREELNIPSGRIVFLAIGFIQESKGFDRLVRAFTRASPRGASCYIVGSLHYGTPEEKAHLNLLEELASGSDDVIIRNEFMTDSEFDSYIAAADYVVLPYRAIWSSGVLARAKLFGKKVIVSDVGGLSYQLEEDDRLFKTEEELERVLMEITKASR